MKEHIFNKLKDFLEATTAQVRKYGRVGLTPYSHFQSRLLGFSTPDGIWAITVNTLKSEFQGPWREDTSLQESYKKFGGVTPISCMTRTLPIEVIVSSYQLLVSQAIEKGLRGDEPV